LSLDNIKPIEIFCGTGGVGKTTLATSRALYLSLIGRKVLLITIDPAKRLKQVLGLEENTEGIIQTVQTSRFTQNEQETTTFDALLLSPSTTFLKISEMAKEKVDLENGIIKILTKPYGGLNEIMAIVEVQRQLNTGLFDTIVLDTPPGKHFIDFLESSKKINKFFDSSFIEIFKYLGKSIDKETASPSLITKLISTGVKKLLSYLEKVTGPEFVETFVDAIINIYRNKNGFLEALSFGDELKKSSFSNWYLVASVDQMKVEEAHDLKNHAKNFMHTDSYLILNRCLNELAEDWSPNRDSHQLFKNILLSKELRLKEYADQTGLTMLPFSEILSSQPESHVEQLCKQWSRVQKEENHD
jgi:anion-transporting  ArsA/GET3 family ATPase